MSSFQPRAVFAPEQQELSRVILSLTNDTVEDGDDWTKIDDGCGGDG